MENLILTQLTIPEVRQILRQELTAFFTESSPAQSTSIQDKPLTIKEASDFLNVAVQTIYGWVGQGTIPYSKKGRRLYFSKEELTVWINSGRKKTVSEITSEAANFGIKRNGQNGK